MQVTPTKQLEKVSNSNKKWTKNINRKFIDEVFQKTKIQMQSIFKFIREPYNVKYKI